MTVVEWIGSGAVLAILIGTIVALIIGFTVLVIDNSRLNVEHTTIWLNETYGEVTCTGWIRKESGYVRYCVEG